MVPSIRKKEQPKTPQTHLVLQNKLARLTWRSKTNSSYLLDATKLSDSQDTTPPITPTTHTLAITTKSFVHLFTGE
ncbi:hypothetical protein TNCV_2078221 [Trichonephila clavipes]|nr:hypothetical protein TNCV_2078221 [Trichonephila clavipes]